MTGENASRAQYATPTPVCVQCLNPPPPHRLAETGYDVAPFLLAGVFLVALGTIIRNTIGRS